MKLRAEFLVGNLTQNEWAGVYGYSPGEEDLFLRFGEIYLVVRLKTETRDINLERVAKLIIDKLQEAYLSESKQYDNLLMRLEGSLWAMKSRMEDILSRETELSKNGLDFEMAIVTVQEDNLYAAVVGESKIYIFRDGEFAEISGALVDANNIGFVKTGSLKLEEQDRVILSTSKSLEYIGEETTKQGVESLDLNIFKQVLNQNGSSILFLVDEALEWQEIIEEVPANKQTLSDSENMDDEDESLNSKVQNPKSKSEDEELESGVTLVSSGALATLKEGLKLKSASVLASFSKLKDNAKLKFENLKNRRSSKGEGLVEEVEVNPKFKIPNSKIEDEDQEFDDEEYEYVEEGALDRVKGGIQKSGAFLNEKVVSKVRNHFKDNKTTYAHVVNIVASRIKNATSGVWETFKVQFIGTGDRRDIYLRGERLKRNRRLLIIFLIILMIVFYFGYKKADANRREQRRIDNAEAKVVEFNNELQTLSSQVDTAKTESEEKKLLISSELDKLASEVTTQKSEGLFLDELNTISDEIILQKDELLLKEVVTQPQVVADIGRVFADSKLADLEYSNGFLYIADSARGVVYRSGTNIDSPVETQASGLVKPYLLERNVSGNVIVFDEETASSVGFLNVNQLGAFERYPSLPQTSIGKVTEAAIFSGNDALYEIHQNHQQIFKRDRAGNAYGGGGITYVTANPPNWKTDAELGSAIDIEAPYEIYVLIKGKGLRRYLGGAANTLTFDQTFENLLRSDFDAMSNATAIDVTQGFMAVAVTQNNNNRILLFQIKDTDAKELVYLKQYVYRGDGTDIFSNVEEVILNEETRKMYVLSGQKVVRLDF